MNNHTPGPWRVGDAANTIFGPPNGKPAPQRIADLAAVGLVAERRANARLIAAAPAMLEALRLHLALIDGDAHDADTQWKDARKMMRAALALAEGRS